MAIFTAPCTGTRMWAREQTVVATTISDRYFVKATYRYRDSHCMTFTN